METKPKVTVGMVNPPRMQSLEESEARRKFTKFGAQTLEEYETKVRQMTTSDIYDHSQKVGIRPSSERKQSVANLISSFKQSLSLMKRYDTSVKTQKVMPQPVYMQNDFLDNH